MQVNCLVAVFPQPPCNGALTVPLGARMHVCNGAHSRPDSLCFMLMRAGWRTLLSSGRRRRSSSRRPCQPSMVGTLCTDG